MSKKSFTIFILIILVILGAVGWYFIFGGASKSGQTGQNNGQQGNPFPFGQGAATTTNSNGGNSSTNPTGNTGTTINLNQPNSAVVTYLRHISLVPTAGAVVFDIGQGSSSAATIRYMERATGHIFETPDQSTVVTQISDVTIPKIHEAIWTPDGNNVILRYLKNDGQTIQTFTAKISTSTPDKAISGSFLADNIQSVSVIGNKLFYLTENIQGSGGIKANIDGSIKTDIIDSSFGDWTSSWTSNDILLSTKPSGNALGIAYTLNPTTGAMNQIMSGIMGLKGLLNSDESLLLYSGIAGGSFSTDVYNVKKATSSSLGVATLADKCVWSKKQTTIVYCAVPRSPDSGLYPDDWYKGKVSFDDAIWKIDTATGVTNIVLDPRLDAGKSMDMMNLSLDQNENVLLFTDKNDMTVWRYDLN